MENKKKPIVVCDICFPTAIEICEIFHRYGLCFDNGKWFIIAQDGHGRHHEPPDQKGSILFYFPFKPTPDPDPDLSLSEKNPECREAKEHDEWVDWVDDWWRNDLKSHPEDGYFFMRAGYERQYDEPKAFDDHPSFDQ